MRATILFVLTVATLGAQAPVAPSPRVAGNPNGENIANYNVTDSTETGYRFRTVGGNQEQYRSVVNFGNGIRILGSSLVIHSRNGHGPLFDLITLTTQGLGNDPYQSAILRAEKNGLYRYDMTWRENDYFNPGLVTAGGGGVHLLDTQRRTQDHDLTLFPQSRWKFFAGFSDTSQNGLANSSVQLFDNTGAIVPLVSNVQRLWRDYRIGNEFTLLGIRVNWIRGWQTFKEDSGATLATSPGTPLGPGYSLATVSDFQASDPYHGTNPYWRVALFANRKNLSVNGRFTYSGGQGAFVVDESAVGSAAAAGQVQNVTTSGNANRPVATGNLNVTFAPSSKVVFSNSTSLYNVRTLGDSSFTQFDSATQTTAVLFYNYLGIRTFSNDTVLNYSVSPWWSLMTGYHYSDRRIQSKSQFTFQDAVTSVPTDQSNQLQSGEFGLRFRPWKPVTALFSAEIGRNSHPFTPLAQRDYHILNGRIQYRVRTLQLAASANANYNVNSVSFTSYASQGRTYTVSGTWAPREWFSLDGGFSRIHVYTIGGIAYFLNQQLTQGQQSVYLSNLNSWYAGVHYSIRRKFDLYGGYTGTQDVGDGRAIPQGPGIGSPLPLFQSVQTFPVLFQSPTGRLSIKITDKVRWNAGYQYYGYRPDFMPTLGFRAHTGYTSISFSF